MATIRKFEDLEVWEKSRNLCSDIFIITNTGDFCKDFALKDQIRRSSGSVMDNIAEGFEWGGNKEFIQFLYFAKGSNGEVRSQLYRSLDYHYVTKEKFDELYCKSNHIGALLHNLITYLSNTQIKGSKYKNIIP